MLVRFTSLGKGLPRPRQAVGTMGWDAKIHALACLLFVCQSLCRARVLSEASNTATETQGMAQILGAYEVRGGRLGVP